MGFRSKTAIFDLINWGGGAGGEGGGGLLTSRVSKRHSEEEEQEEQEEEDQQGLICDFFKPSAILFEYYIPTQLYSFVDGK